MSFTVNGLEFVTVTGGTYYEILLEGDNTNPLQEVSQFKPLGHSVRKATTNFNLTNMKYLIL